MIARLNAAVVVDMLVDPAVRAPRPNRVRTSRRADKRCLEVLAAFQRAEIEKWWPIIKAAGIKGGVTSDGIFQSP